MDKKQKQELNDVLKKYNRSKGQVAGSYLRSLGKGAVVGVVLDVIFTAGFGTLAAITAASYPTLKAMGRGAAKKGLEQLDPRMQKTNAGADAQIILFTLHMKLSDAFNKAVTTPDTRTALGQERIAHFHDVAAEAKEDVRRLAPSFKIVSGGTNNYGTDEYKLLVRRTIKGKAGSDELLTLDEAAQAIEKKIAADLLPPAPKKPKKPANDIAPTPSPAKKKPGFTL